MGEAQAETGYDPDRWARRWALVMGAALLITRLVPGSAPSGPVWLWDNLAGPRAAIDALAPVVAGLLALAAAAVRGRRARVLLVVVGALTVAAVHVAHRPFVSPPFTWTFLDLSAAASGITAAAAAHMRRRHAERRGPRITALVSGLVLAASVVALHFVLPSFSALPGESGRIAVSNALRHLLTGYVASYGIVTALHASSGGNVAFRSSLLGAMSRVFVPLRALLLVISADLYFREYSTLAGADPPSLTMEVVSWCRHVGTGAQAALCALALAASWEALATRSARREIHMA
jgi:hypothetical protein